uniref:Semaphorin 7A n=1 Tax=Iconisemion striatum TaxID=60296 RepID=A0A1A7YT47_9TELE
MIRLFYFPLLLLGEFHLVQNKDLQETPTLGSTKTPRLLITGLTKGGYIYDAHQNHSVFLYQEDSDELYVGGTDFVLKLDGNDYHILEEYPLKTTEQHQCFEGPCTNEITVIEKFQDSVFVCGTNGLKPKCWKLFPSVSNQSYEIVESYEGTGISPFVYTQNSLSLTVDGDLYAAAPLDVEGSSLQFRRKAGSRTNVWMYDSWVSEPTFIAASWVKRVNDPDNEKIYIFFREKNSDPSPEADPWISRVARVCKVDEGGSKRFFQNTWTSFLKARLVCGFPDESLYFNRLQDIFVMHAEDWLDTKVYALFSSSWNSTAVCIYSIATIESVFENSTFKGYNKEVPHPRPGTCVPNSKSLSSATVNVVKDYPEMTDWVHSLHHKAPFYTSNNNYTKIAVDRVQAADQHMYNVLLLATDSGKIHKVLEAGSEPFIVSETQLSSTSAVQAMKLDSKKKKLVIGFSEKISFVDLQNCDKYGSSCAECVLARDPYCAWDGTSCTRYLPNTKRRFRRQDVRNGDPNTLCSGDHHKHRVAERKLYGVEGSSTFLECIPKSLQAKVTWTYQKQPQHPREEVRLDDRILQTERGLLIRRVLKRDIGVYQCHAMEHGFTQTLLGITLEVVPSSSSSMSNLPSDAPVRLDPRSGGGSSLPNQKFWYRDFMQLVDHPNLSTVDQICEQVWARKNAGSDQVDKIFPAAGKDILPQGPPVRPANKKWKHLQEIRKGRNRRTHDGKPNPRAPRSAGE